MLDVSVFAKIHEARLCRDGICTVLRCTPSKCKSTSLKFYWESLLDEIDKCNVTLFSLYTY